jgi:hypothetical protein
MRLLGIFGLLLILTGEVLSFFPVLPWAQHVFPIFWYGYILVLDSLNYQLRGTSLLFGRRREFLLMLLISAAYWYVFEWYNLAIENWVYLNTPTEIWIEITMKIVSFATVIPAIYETADLLAVILPTGKGLQVRPLIPSNWHGISLTLGFLLSILPLLLPKFFFWSVWLGLFFLIDPINDRLRRSSILSDWHSGDLRRTTFFLLAGYVCGFFWEFFFNDTATTEIYTVPVPEMPHIFEMPILGFLGFGPFGLETFAFWTLIWRRDKNVN